jgi:hypothetical protein
MKRQHVSALLVTGLATAMSLASGCQSGWNYPVATRVATSTRVFAARVSDLASNRGRLLPFSISGTRRFQTPIANANRSDPLRRTNEELASLLGTDNELVQALANRDNFQPLPFAVAPQPEKPKYALEVVEDSRPLQPLEPKVEEQFEKLVDEKPAEVAELPSAETFDAEDNSQGEVTAPLDSAAETGEEDLSPDVPQPISEEDRLREERIQQLLDLLAKAEALAQENNVPELPPAPIIERAKEAELEKTEPLIIPPPPQAPKEIVLRATATMPYQSVRSERVELLNVQQMAPTIPARPGIPAVVVSPPAPSVNAPGWANNEWNKGLVPDFSALGKAAPEQVEFAPLPASSEALNQSPTANSQGVSGGESSLGKITPEVDSNPATAARPIQKNEQRR